MERLVGRDQQPEGLLIKKEKTGQCVTGASCDVCDVSFSCQERFQNKQKTRRDFGRSNMGDSWVSQILSPTGSLYVHRDVQLQDSA